MTVNELGRKLREMYETKGANKSTMIHLFGAIYYDEMRSNNIKATEVVRAAQMPESYHSEVSKGMNLAKYLQLKPEYEGKF
ncbi:MAG: hypothetical protein RSF86_13545 [Angelakisella sp.]